MSSFVGVCNGNGYGVDDDDDYECIDVYEFISGAIFIIERQMVAACRRIIPFFLSFFIFAFLTHLQQFVSHPASTHPVVVVVVDVVVGEQ